MLFLQPSSMQKVYIKSKIPEDSTLPQIDNNSSSYTLWSLLDDQGHDQVL